MSPQPTGQALGMAGALTAMVAWGASGVLAKLIDMDGLAVVVYRFWLSTVVFVAYLVLVTGRRTGRRLTWDKFRTAIPGGLGLSLDVAFFFSAVKLTTVANASVVTSLQPLLMMYLGRRLLGERIRPGQVAWSLVALAGVALLLFGASGLPEASPIGDLLAVGALLSWTGYLYFSKSTQGKLTPLEYTAATGVIAVLVNTPLALAFGQDLSWPSAASWVLLAVMALGSGLVAHLLMNWSLTRIPVTVGATLSLLIPVGATLMAWWVLDEAVNLTQGAGMALTLVALGAITLSNRNANRAAARLDAPLAAAPGTPVPGSLALRPTPKGNLP